MGFDLIIIIKTIVLAIVEGITEFIPVSSTGHLILTSQIMNFQGEFAKMFEVVCQLAAIMAVVVLFWNKIYTSIIEFFRFIYFYINNLFSKNKVKISKEDETGFKFGINVIVGSIPMAFVGATCYDNIKNLFRPEAVIVGLFLGGFLLLFMEKYYSKKPKHTTDVDNLTPLQSFKVGVFQCLAVWPGMSRSASTIMGGWFGGLSTPLAAEFSFFLAIPAMVGSTGIDLLKFDYSIMNTTYWIALIVGCIVSFLVSLVVVKKFIDYLKTKPMKVFAIYRIILSIAFTVLVLMKVITLS